MCTPSLSQFFPARSKLGLRLWMGSPTTTLFTISSLFRMAQPCFFYGIPGQGSRFTQEAWHPYQQSSHQAQLRSIRPCILSVHSLHRTIKENPQFIPNTHTLFAVSYVRALRPQPSPSYCSYTTELGLKWISRISLHKRPHTKINCCLVTAKPMDFPNIKMSVTRWITHLGYLNKMPSYAPAVTIVCWIL